ncbi:MAG: hypothetical protein NT019_01945 [Candidatus Adlerbacteria bacterium]|nr:hypothetical protein [Candidatus Adlerbacteria bacterium]
MVDTIVRIDRSTVPTQPQWLKKPLHPELATTGPAEYDLAAIQLWLHEKQKEGAKGQTLYGHLTRNNMLEGCLGYADGLAIQQKGLEVFRGLFGRTTLFLWRSVGRSSNRRLVVPCIGERNDELLLGSNCVHGLEEITWGSDYPAGCYPS